MAARDSSTGSGSSLHNNAVSGSSDTGKGTGGGASSSLSSAGMGSAINTGIGGESTASASTSSSSSSLATATAYQIKLPVLVFVHGESYEWNSGNPYDGSVLSSFGQILVVTINYRLGLLGKHSNHVIQIFN